MDTEEPLARSMPPRPAPDGITGASGGIDVVRRFRDLVANRLPSGVGGRAAAAAGLCVATIAVVFAVTAMLRSGAPAAPAASLADLVVPGVEPAAGVAVSSGAQASSLSTRAASSPGGLSSTLAPGQPGEDGPLAQSDASVAEQAAVTVHVAGGVVRPGLVRLPAGARVADALTAAGGPERADLDRINLAERVADGQRVWIPRVGEPTAPPAVALAAVASTPTSANGATAAPGASGLGAGSASTGVVHLNSASEADLDTLPGVGPATASAIVAYRDEHGPFRTVDDLLEVRGIGPAKLAAMRSRLDL